MLKTATNTYSEAAKIGPNESGTPLYAYIVQKVAPKKNSIGYDNVRVKIFPDFAFVFFAGTFFKYYLRNGRNKYSAQVYK